MRSHVLRRMGTWLVLWAVVGALAGCTTLARQPQLTNARIAPADLKPGDTAVISVHVADRYQLVHKVDAVVREDPAIKLKLRDDGKPPDEKAGDNIWTLQVDVPFQALPGGFNLDITAYGADGAPLRVRMKGRGVTPLMASVPLAIRTP